LIQRRNQRHIVVDDASLQRAAVTDGAFMPSLRRSQREIQRFTPLGLRLREVTKTALHAGRKISEQQIGFVNLPRIH
ncbi:hypothetical protein, partial [Escherichia coli]|uniref:hypothetical protein n=1 Tax=Escherichia coli TaxID=562 RepID=UPI001954736F